MTDPLDRRLGAQLLTGGPAPDPETVVARILAVQAQNGRGARLAVRPRSTGVTAADVDEALTRRRSLVVTTLNRGTLHLVTAEDYWWLHRLTTPQLARAAARNLANAGVGPQEAERGVAVLAEAVRAGPATRADLRARLAAAGISSAGPVLMHLIFAASVHHPVVRGPVVDGEHLLVDAESWLGARPDPLDDAEAAARLARRYLAGHGPASAADLATWAGIGLRAARSALAAIDDETEPGGDRLVDLAGRPAPPPAVPAHLLGPFDPLLHGWVGTDAVLGPYRDRIVSANGIFGPVAAIAGRAVGTWSVPGPTLTITCFEPVPAGDLDALVADAAGVGAFLGLGEVPVTVDRP